MLLLLTVCWTLMKLLTHHLSKKIRFSILWSAHGECVLSFIPPYNIYLLSYNHCVHLSVNGEINMDCLLFDLLKYQWLKFTPKSLLFFFFSFFLREIFYYVLREDTSPKCKT